MTNNSTYSVGIFFLLLAMVSTSSFATKLPRPAALDPAVKFWTRIYTEVGTNAGLIHDAENLEVVYQKVHFSEGLSRRQRARKIKYIKASIKRTLLSLAKGKRTNLTAKERNILSAWPQGVSNYTLKRASREIRFQLGQANKYKAGLIRSGKWRSYIEGVFRQENIPVKIALLPHVESSFNPDAYSKVGAAGLWQFTRGTGRRFMRVDHIVDERLDPYKATKAAAALLNHNYSVTGTWPLAITSYNHGSAGMRNATRVVGTNDIVQIIKKYKGRTFGFASRNFYVAFLAAVGVDENYEKYFGEIRKLSPISPKIVTVPDYIPARNLSKALGISLSSMRSANPSLRPSVWNGNKYIPKNFQIYLPDSGHKKPAENLIAGIPEKYRFTRQKRDVTYVVRRGNTLSQIARRFRVSVRELKQLNNIRSARYLRVGQRLRLPQRGQRIAETQIASTKPAKENIKVASAKSKPVVTKKSKPRPSKPFTGTTYKVKRGDTVYSIAKQFKVKQHTILALNDLRRRSRIYPGQELKISRKSIETASASKTKLPKKAAATPDKTDKPVQLSMNEATKNAASKQDKSTPVVENKESKPETEPAESASDEKASVAVASEEDSAGTNKDLNQLVNESENTASENDTNQPAVDNEVAIVKLEQQEMSSAESAEPAADEAENEVSPGSPAGGAHAQLAADPSNYEVASNNTIEVQAEETLGHYADWLEIRASQLRKINKMRFRTPVVVGKRIKLSFKKINQEEFLRRRLAYHRTIQEEFFSQYHIDKTKEYKIRRGETLWSLTNRKFNIPVWLLRQHNPDVDFEKLHPNTKIIIPIVKETEKPDQQEQAKAA